MRLEELEDELEYEEIKMTAMQNLINVEMRELIVEMVKEHVIGQLKGTLQYVVDQEIV